MSANNPCHPCPGCRARTPNSKYACPGCWARLPRDVQQSVMNVAHASDTERARVLAAAADLLRRSA